MKKFVPRVAIFTILLAATTVGAVLAQKPPAPSGGPTVDLEEIASGLVAPIGLVPSPDDTGRLFIVDQVGLVRVWTPESGLLPTPFLDIQAELIELMPEYDERGLLGLAFHPDYAENGRFFVFYNAPLSDGGPAGWDDTIVIGEYAVSDDPNVADPASEVVILEIDKPQFNHNGGTLLFGGDGYLYISVGDGGGGNDVGEGHVEDWYPDNAGGNGQDLEANLMGSILRIDVDGSTPYAIPPDNPFVEGPGMDEVWAYGFRNPYRMEWDGTALFVGDAGQGLWEEVSIVESGGNYGWNVKEGTHCFDAEDSEVIPPTCPSETDEGVPLIDPVIEYANAANPDARGIGVVVVAGDVYRGTDLPQLEGDYIFGDFSTSPQVPDGTLLLAKPRENRLWKIQRLKVQGAPGGRFGHYLTGFGTDLDGEMYVLGKDVLGPTGDTGKVFRIVGPGNS